jgi:hypothetical protein
MTQHSTGNLYWDDKQDRRYASQVPPSALEAQLNGAVKGLDHQDEEMVRTRRASLPASLQALFDQYIASQRQ